MEIAIGFVIAMVVGITGVGASIATPALVLIAGLSGAEAVGTALVFSMIVRLTAVPFYIRGKHIHLRYLWLMLTGAIPGLLIGTCLLASFDSRRWNSLVLVLIGVVLAGSSIFTSFVRSVSLQTNKASSSWLPWLTFPVGMQTGFSSSGAGALGTILLFNCSELSTASVVGTDLMFGIFLAGIGSALHFGFGSISMAALKTLLLGGIPGVLLGCVVAPRVPSQRLKPFIVAFTFLLGVQLVWNGIHTH